MRKNQLIGLTIIVVVCLALGSIGTVGITKSYKLTKEVQELKVKKDCTVHDSIIKNLETENKQLRDQIVTLDSNEEEQVIQDAEFFVKKLYSSMSLTTQQKEVRPLVLDSAYNSLFPVAFEGEDTESDNYFSLDIINMTSYYKKINTSTARVMTFLDVKTENRKDDSLYNVFHNIIEYELIYNTEKDKWIVSQILRKEQITYKRSTGE